MGRDLIFIGGFVAYLGQHRRPRTGSRARGPLDLWLVLGDGRPPGEMCQEWLFVVHVATSMFRVDFKRSFSLVSTTANVASETMSGNPVLPRGELVLYVTAVDGFLD